MSSVTQDMSSTQIFDAVKQLPSNELEEFVNRVLVLQAKKRANNLSGEEMLLLKGIYRKFSTEKLSRLKLLREKLESEELSEQEYTELAALAEKHEEFHARRMKKLVEYTKIRGLGLEETMSHLEIKFPDYD